MKAEYQSLWTAINSGLSNKIFPDESDLEMMSVNLNRIQHTYDLDVYDLANGILRGLKSQARLSRDEVPTDNRVRFCQESRKV